MKFHLIAAPPPLAGESGAVRGDTKDFLGLTVIELPGHGPAGDGNTDEPAVLDSAVGELVADRRRVVSGVLGDELVRFLQMKWDGLHSVIKSYYIGFYGAMKFWFSSSTSVPNPSV